MFVSEHLAFSLIPFNANELPASVHNFHETTAMDAIFGGWRRSKRSPICSRFCLTSYFLSFALFSLNSFTRYSVGLSDLLYVKPRGHKSTVCCSGDGGTFFSFECVLLSTLAWHCDINQTPTINRVIFSSEHS